MDIIPEKALEPFDGDVNGVPFPSCLTGEREVREEREEREERMEGKRER